MKKTDTGGVTALMAAASAGRTATVRVLLSSGPDVNARESTGATALMGEDCPDAPLDGVIEQTLRRSIMMVVGGGTAQIQRTLIAQRGLMLPR